MHFRILTRSSAIAEKPRCRVGQFWVGGGWRRGSDVLCRCHKTNTIDLLHDKSTFIRKTVTLRFYPPPSFLRGGGRDLEAAYNNLRLITKRVVVPISDKFFASCYCWDGTSENRLEIAVFEGVDHCGLKFQVEGDIPYEPSVHDYTGQWMPYNFVAEIFHTKKLSQLETFTQRNLREVHF